MRPTAATYCCTGRATRAAASFEREAPYGNGGRRVRTAQAASPDPVRPLAKLAVTSADFPLPIRSHDQVAQAARIEADPGGFPWLEPG